MLLSERCCLSCLFMIYMLSQGSLKTSAMVLDGEDRLQARQQPTLQQGIPVALNTAQQPITIQSPSASPIAAITVINASPQPSPTPPPSGASYITTLQTLIISTSTLGVPGLSPAVQSSQSNERVTSSSSHTAATTSSAPTATSALPIQVTLDPTYGVAGAVFIVSGIAMCFMGLRNRWTSYFLTGFYLVSICILLFILRFMPAADPSNKAKGLYLLAMFGAGILAGLLSLPLYYLSKYLIGALGGFSLAMTILFLHDDGLISAAFFVLRIIFVFVLMIFGPILSTFKSIHQHIVLGSTAIAGSFFFILGVDCFTSAGLKEFVVFLWGFSSLFPTSHFPFAQGIQIEVGVIIAMTLVGVVVQLKVWDAVQKKQRSTKSKAKLVHHVDDEEAAAENLNAQLTTERDEWERRHSVVGDRVPSITAKVQEGATRLTLELSDNLRNSKRFTLESRKEQEAINFLPKIDLGFGGSEAESTEIAPNPKLSFEGNEHNGSNDAVQRAIDQYYEDIARIERNKKIDSAILDTFADTTFRSSSAAGIVFPKSRIVSEPEQLQRESKSSNLPRRFQEFEDVQAQRDLAVERERNRRELDALKMEIERLKQRSDVSAMDVLQTLVADLNRAGQGNSANERGAPRDARRREFSEPRGRSRRPQHLRSQSADLLERESGMSVSDDIHKPFIQLPANGKMAQAPSRKRMSGLPELSFFDVNAVHANLDRQRVLEQEVNMPERERLDREQAADDAQVLPDRFIDRAVVSPTPRELAERHCRLMRGLQSRAKGLEQLQVVLPSEHPTNRKVDQPTRHRVNGERSQRNQELYSSRIYRESGPLTKIPGLRSGERLDTLNSLQARNQSATGHQSRRSEADTQARLDNRIRNWV